MSQELRTYALIAFAAGATAASVFFFPPLTSPDSTSSEQLDRVSFEEALHSERAYCHRHADVLDCSCFANVSAYILSQRVARAPFAVYPDRKSLARTQATDNC